MKGFFLNFFRIIVSVKENYYYLLDLLNLEIYFFKNFKVRCGLLVVSVLLIEIIKRVLLVGIYKFDVFSNWFSIFKLKV